VSPVPIEVSVSPELLAKAHSEFPPGGSVDGRPSLELFVRGPLDAAKQIFAREFDAAPEPIPGLGAMRQCDTLSSIFGPIFFYAIKKTDGIEIVDYLYDPNYWELVSDDPGD
jgi:hypothetical protein